MKGKSNCHYGFFGYLFGAYGRRNNVIFEYKWEALAAIWLNVHFVASLGIS